MRVLHGLDELHRGIGFVLEIHKPGASIGAGPALALLQPYGGFPMRDRLLRDEQ